MTKISLNELDEMVEYIDELTKIYERNEKRECIFNPLIFLKMLSLPFYTSKKEIRDKEKIIEKILANTPCQDRLQVYKEQFIVFYKAWLKKHYPEILDLLDDIDLLRMVDENEFIEIDRETDISTSNHQKVDAKTFLAHSDIDEKMIFEVMASINNMITFSKEYKELNEEFVENLFSKNEFIQFFLYSIEFKNLSYSLEILKLKLLSFDLDKLSTPQQTLLKMVLDTILEDLNSWVYKVLVEKSAIDIHYLDDSLLANISQIDLILESLKSEDSSDEDDEMELF